MWRAIGVTSDGKSCYLVATEPSEDAAISTAERINISARGLGDKGVHPRYMVCGQEEWDQHWKQRI